MSLLGQIRQLIADGNVRVSQHGFRRLVSHAISSEELLAGVEAAIVVEEYPSYYVGPAVLVLQWDAKGEPLHAVWGIESGTSEPAVLVTAYRPDAARWTDDFRNRKS